MASRFPHVSVLAIAGSSLGIEPIPVLTRAHEYANSIREHAVVTTSVEVVHSPDHMTWIVDDKSTHLMTTALFVVGPITISVREHIEMVARKSGRPVLFEDDIIAVVVAVRAASALDTFSRDPGRARVAVVAPSGTFILGTLLLALGAGEVTHWDSYDALATAYPEEVTAHDVVVDVSRREALDHPGPSHVVGYPREVLEVCASIVSPVIGTLCDSVATSSGIDVWVAVARALYSIRNPCAASDWDHAGLLIAAFVRHALNPRS